MESITKNRQPPAVLRAMIERAYGSERVPHGEGWARELGHGWFNVAYRIRLRDGAEVVLKIAPPPGVEVLTYERGAMGTELAALELIREHTGVPVPAVDFADRGHELCDADYFFMPFIDADNLGVIEDRLPAAERDAYHERLGAANRELNSVRGTAFGPLAGPGDASWRRVFTGMFEDVLADGERRAVDLGRPYATVRAVLTEYAPALDAVVEPRLVEWDLWGGNVMVREGRIVCVIDHERAFWGDPLIEAGFTGTQLPAFGDSTAFLRGYGHGPLTENETWRRRLYCLYLVLVMVIETDYRGHTDTRQYDWARERLTEAMALFGRTGP
ncbi:MULTISPECIES: phosphotransferase family protein [unclassified Streptomyces]|uniref:phosphotransferase family protein n=1 Tax=unclassified Streptomyces TaxID=2593676 RepID=UPI001908FD0D|nr:MULTISPECIES: aminoglycoside phosphotransferase family protein [unclassified Streptomyces]MCU4748947.1 aminoglycoside phosphotransferase family protein [Streptomyces sp. G-5]QQN80384.1 aminoglycoside phosphotransferase family protein [Streptomyces sp. XC 2026]